MRTSRRSLAKVTTTHTNGSDSPPIQVVQDKWIAEYKSKAEQLDRAGTVAGFVEGRVLIPTFGYFSEYSKDARILVEHITTKMAEQRTNPMTAHLNLQAIYTHSALRRISFTAARGWALLKRDRAQQVRAQHGVPDGHDFLADESDFVPELEGGGVAPPSHRLC